MVAINVTGSQDNISVKERWEVVPYKKRKQQGTSSTGSIKIADVGIYYNQRWNSFTSVISPNDINDLEDDITIDASRKLEQIKSIILSDFKRDVQEFEKNENIKHLFEMEHEQKADDDDFVSHQVFSNTLVIILNVIRQPEIFKTYENSMNLQYEATDSSYLEFEVFEDRITCMIVPKREYSKAYFPDVQLGNTDRINEIVGEFYGIV